MKINYMTRSLLLLLHFFLNLKFDPCLPQLDITQLCNLVILSCYSYPFTPPSSPPVLQHLTGRETISWGQTLGNAEHYQIWNLLANQVKTNKFGLLILVEIIISLWFIFFAE